MWSPGQLGDYYLAKQSLAAKSGRFNRFKKNSSVKKYNTQYLHEYYDIL